MFWKVGVTDERDSCDCCGKQGLKRTVVMRDSEGEFYYLGTECATVAPLVASYGIDGYERICGPLSKRIRNGLREILEVAGG